MRDVQGGNVQRWMGMRQVTEGRTSVHKGVSLHKGVWLHAGVWALIPPPARPSTALVQTNTITCLASLLPSSSKYLFEASVLRHRSSFICLTL